MNASQKIHNATLNKWLSLFQDQAKSGKTVKVWCAENGLSFHAYYYWKRIAKETYYDSMAPDIVPISAPVTTIASAPQAPVLSDSDKSSDFYDSGKSYNSYKSCNSLESHKSYNLREPISVSIGGISINIGAEASDELITRIIGAIRHA